MVTPTQFEYCASIFFFFLEFSSPYVRARWPNFSTSNFCFFPSVNRRISVYRESSKFGKHQYFNYTFSMSTGTTPVRPTPSPRSKGLVGTSKFPDASPVLAQVSSASVKLPAFWAHDPELWFYQVEAMFVSKRVNSEIGRYNHLVASITPEVAANVRRFIVNRPEHDPYSKLKSVLLERYALSPAKQLQALTSETLGDRTPSQLLDRLEQLGLASMGEAMQQQLFISKLPESVRVSLVGLDMGMIDLARRADRVLEQVDRSAAVFAVVQEQPSAPQYGSKQRAAASQRPQPARRLAPASAPSPRPSTNMGTDGTGQSICYYHWRFGKDASKCQPGCSMASN